MKPSTPIQKDPVTASVAAFVLSQRKFVHFINLERFINPVRKAWPADTKKTTSFEDDCKALIFQAGSHILSLDIL
jgi:hypothetical protein